MISPDSLPAAPGIYCLTNLNNGKLYIGLAKNMRQRVRGHLKAVAKGKSHLYSALRKHGLNAFEASVVERCDEAALQEREVWWIDALRTVSPRGYNLSRGGDFSPMEHPEVRAKAAAAIRKAQEAA